MTKANNTSNAFRVTEYGQLIPSVRELVAVDNVSITTSAWSAITVPAGVNCKSIIAKTRNNNNWLLGAITNATEYMTMDGVLEIAIAQSPGATLFYAKAAVNDTLEIAFFD